MDDEKELWINYKRTGSLEIREKLTLQYIPLVKYIVNKVIKTLPKNIEYEDMVEYGIIGLLDAVEKFDITKDINFKTYAVLRIRGAIYDELRVMDMLPRTLRTLSKNIENAYIEIEKKNGRAATDEEVAAYLNIEIKELDEIHSKINVANVSSLNDILHNSEDGKMTVGDIVEDKKMKTHKKV
jgi:RNA polymerase sigma factor FliA